MDKKKAALNVGVSIFFNLLVLVTNILTRRLVIQFIGEQILGLNDLYLSIINVLSVAELGIGSAITFSMYKPMVEGNDAKVAALFRLFTKIYLVVGAIILIGGLAVMPALPYLAKGYETAGENLYLTFGLMLLSVVMSYVYSAKTSLINAYKNNYITTAIDSSGTIFMRCLQIGVTVLFRSFFAYLCCRVLTVALQWAVTEIISRVKYGKVMKIKASLDGETKKEVTKNVKAMFMHKIGGVLVNSADSLIISAFIGVAVLGKYSNYTTIMTALVSLISLAFTPLTSVLGHMCAEENKETAQRYFRFFYTVNFILGAIFFLGYYAVIDNVIYILLGSNLELNRAIAFVITLNNFVSFMRRSVMLFRDATGTFYYDRWKPLGEGICNIVLSIIFVLVFPEEFKVVGVIVATIITNILICHVVEPYVLFKHFFGAPVRKFYLRNYLSIAAFTALLILTDYCMVDIGRQWLNFVANGFIAVGIGLVPCAVAVLTNRDVRYYIKHFKDRRKHKSEALPPPEAVGTVEVPEEVVAPEKSEENNLSGENGQ